MEVSESSELGVTCTYAVGEFAYLQIPADNLRHFFDNLFPSFAKNSTADVAKGFGHRWVAGHDLLIDIPKTVFNSGIADGLAQTGHILLTDFPTKAGIPIPGFSKSGFGQFLTETCGIPKSYLCLNIMDTGIGIFAISEGAYDLHNVITEQLRMTPELFVDTFVEGGVDIATGAVLTNPLLLTAGIEQVIAGIISTYNTITKPLWFVSPADFFTGMLFAGTISFAISSLVFRKDKKEAVCDITRSMTLGGLFAVSSYFGVGGILALLCGKIGKVLANKTNKDISNCFKVNQEVVDSLFSKSPLFPNLLLNRGDLLNGVRNIPFETDCFGINRKNTVSSLIKFKEKDIYEDGVEVRFKFIRDCT